MNLKIKNLIIILVLLIGVSFFSGCIGEKQGGEQATTPKTGESLTEVLAKAKDVVSYKYDAVITTPNQPAITAKFWLKENKMRWEGTYEAQNVVYLIDQDELTSYLYTPAQNIAIKMNFNKAQETVGESPTEQSESVTKYNPVTVGTEVLDGKTCLVIEYSAGTEQVKMWLWTKYGLPIRTETTTVQGTTVVELKNIEFGDIPDSLFELPAGVQPMQIPSFGF